MADLGNLYFGFHLKDLSDKELDDIVQKIQTRLESNKINLGIDYDKRAVEQVVGKITKTREQAIKSSSKKLKTEDLTLTFDEKKAAANAETMERTYKSMFDKISELEDDYIEEQLNKKKRLKEIEKEAKAISAQHATKANSDRFAEMYYRKLKHESRTLGRTLDSLYVDRKSGVIGGDKTERAIKLIKDKMAELQIAQNEFKKNGTFNRGLWERMQDGDFKDSITQAKQMIDAEKKLSKQKRRDAEIDAKINADIEREREALMRADMQRMEAESAAIQKQQALKQKVADEEARINKKIESDYRKDGLEADKNRAKLEKERLANMEREARILSDIQAKKQKALDYERERNKREKQRTDRENERKRKRNEATDYRISNQVEKDRVKEQNQYLKGLEREARVLSDIEAKKQKIAEFEKNRKASSMKGHAKEITIYDSIGYKNSMSSLRAQYQEEERFSKAYQKAHDKHRKQKEKDAKTDAKILADLEREEQKAQKAFEERLNKESLAIQKRQVQRQKALDFEKKQNEIKAKRDEAELKRLIKQEEAEKKRHLEMIARSKKNHNIAGSVYDSIDYKNSMAQMKRFYQEQARVRKQEESENLTSSQKKIRELARISSEIKRYENEISKLKLGQRTGVLAGEGIKEAIRLLEDYKKKLENAVRTDKRSGVLGEMKSGISSATINQARILAQEQGILNRKREEAARKAALQRNEIMRLNSAHKNEYRLMGQLKNQFLNVYSIYELERFARSVIEIGGEFQKQRIALRAMLGDISKADTMFGQIKELAIESPFNFRDLMGFTKQISAFGIPYEEMYDTTKRLADISAGLGVDMNRLVLAWGQVRSASVLRGQELRQFTEAGIPLVDELAKKFTILEGRIVSAGEVFDKISKREVSANMVKDILWQMTDEGGRFYNMQEVLTKSLPGKWAKLKDSWEIMLGSVAEGVNGPLGKALDMMSAMTEEWGKAIGVITTLTAAYGTYKTVLMAVAIKRNFLKKVSPVTDMIREARRVSILSTAIGGYSKAVTIARFAQVMLNSAVEKFGKGSVFAVALSIVLALAAAITSAYLNANKLNSELEKIKGDTLSASNNEIRRFKELTNNLDKAVKGTAEYNNIIDKIQSQYGSYLGNLKKEAYSYETLSSQIDNVTASLKAKHAEEARQRGLTAIKDEFGSRISDLSENFTDTLKDFGVSDSTAKAFAIKLRETVENMLANNEKVDSDVITEEMLRTIGIERDLNKNNPYDTLAKSAYMFTSILTKSNMEFDRFNKSLYNLSTDEYQKVVDKIANERKTLKDKTSFANKDEEREFNKETIRQTIEAVKDIPGAQKTVEDLQLQMANLENYSDKWVEMVNAVRDSIAKSAGMGEEFLKNVMPSEAQIEGEQMIEWLGEIPDKYEEVSKSLKEIESVPKSLLEPSHANRKETLKSTVEFYKEIAKVFHINLNKKKGTESEKDVVLEGIKERISLIKDAYSEYEKWSKLVGDKEASKHIKESGLFSILDDNDIPKNLEEYKKKVGEIQKDLEEAIKKSSSKERRDALRSVLKQMLDINYDITKDVRMAEIEDMREYLKEYGSLEQQRLAITKEYEDKISKARTEGKKKSLEKERDKKLGALSYEYISNGIDWKSVFSGVGSLAEGMAKPMLEQLKSYTQTDEFKNADSQTQKSILDLISELRKLVGSDSSITWKKLADDIAKFEESVSAYKKAVTSEKQGIAYHQQMKDKFAKGKISEEELKKSERAVSALGEATAKAKNNMQNLANIVNHTSDEIANFTSKLSVALNNATGWEKVEGFSQFKDSISKIDGLKADLDKFLSSSSGKESETGAGLSEAIGKGLDKMNTGLGKIFSSGLGQMVGIIAQIPKLILTVVSAVKGFVTGIINSFAELFSLRWIDDLVNSILEAIGNLINAFFDLPENIYKVFESIVVNGIGGLVDTIAGRVGNILSFGALSSKGPSEWFKNSNAEEVAELQNRLIESNKLLGTAIDDLRESMAKTSGTKAIEEAKQAKAYQEQYNKNLLDIAWAQAGYHNSHNSWMKNWGGFNQEQIDRFSKKLGYGWDGNIFSLSPEEMKKLRTEIDMWNQIGNTGKGGYGWRLIEKLNAYADQAGKLEEINNTLYQSLTQVSFDSLRNTFIDSLMDMDRSAKDFANDFQRYMMKAVLNAKISDMLDEDLKKFYNDWGSFSESGNELDKNEIGKLKEQWQNIINKGLAIRDDASKITGYTGDEKDSGGLSKGIKGVTEQTADLLASYINAIRADVSFKRSLLEKFVNSEVPKLSTIAQSQLTQLNVIAANTSRNVQLVEDIYNILHRNITPGKGFKIG